MYESYIKKLSRDIEKIESEECELMSKEEDVFDTFQNLSDNTRNWFRQCHKRNCHYTKLYRF